MKKKIIIGTVIVLSLLTYLIANRLKSKADQAKTVTAATFISVNTADTAIYKTVQIRWNLAIA